MESGPAWWGGLVGLSANPPEVSVVTNLGAGLPSPAPPHYLPRPTHPSDTQCRPCNSGSPAAIGLHVALFLGLTTLSYVGHMGCMWPTSGNSDQSCQPSVQAAGRRHTPCSRAGPAGPVLQLSGTSGARPAHSIREPGRVATHGHSTHHTAATHAHHSPMGDALMTHSATPS